MASVVIGLFPPDRVSVSFPYDTKIISALKAIAGHRWNPAQKLWTFPRNDSVVTELRRIFAGTSLDIDPALTGDTKPSTAGRLRVSRAHPVDDSLFLLQRELRLRNYSHKTIKAYRSCVRSRRVNGGRLWSIWLSGRGSRPLSSIR